jgi:hypothetical protein
MARPGSLTCLAAALALTAAVSSGRAVDAHAPEGAQRPEPPTSFELALAESCSPCVRETYPITTVQVPAVALPSAARVPNTVLPRASELGFEALRAYPLGQPERQFMAMRVSLFVAVGGVAEPYRLAVGLMDESELPALSNTLAHIAQHPPGARGESGPSSTEIDYLGGSLRVGLVRFRSDAVGYVQAGDPATLLGRRVLEVPTSVYFAASHLPVVAGAIDQVIAKMRTLRAPQ